MKFYYSLIVLSGSEKQSNQEIWKMRLAAYLRPFLLISWIFEKCFNDGGSPLYQWLWFLLCFGEVPAHTQRTSTHQASAINGLQSTKKKKKIFSLPGAVLLTFWGHKGCSLLETVNISGWGQEGDERSIFSVANSGLIGDGTHTHNPGICSNPGKIIFKNQFYLLIANELI